MSRLEKRVGRLEGGISSDEVFALGQYPIGLSQQQLRIAVEAKARERGIEAPVSIHQLHNSGRPGGEADIEIWFIGTQADLSEIWERVMDRNATGATE